MIDYTLLINAGVAGVFAIFAIFITKEFIKFLTTQNELWRKYLDGEREQRSATMESARESMNTVATSLAELSKQIAMLTQIVTRMEARDALQEREAAKMDVGKQAETGS